MLTLSALLVKVAFTNWMKSSTVDDKQLEVFLKGYESGKKIGYTEGIDATINVFRANPELFKSESPSSESDKSSEKIEKLLNTVPSTSQNLNKS